MRADWSPPFYVNNKTRRVTQAKVCAGLSVQQAQQQQAGGSRGEGDSLYQGGLSPACRPTPFSQASHRTTPPLPHMALGVAS